MSKSNARKAASSLLNAQDYFSQFLLIQEECFASTKMADLAATTDTTEEEIATIFQSELALSGIRKFWYPNLVGVGRNSGMPLTRNQHLPGPTKIRTDDVVILDTSPLKGTVWGNWAISKPVGDDPFYKTLCTDVFKTLIETVAFVLRSPRSLRDIYFFCMHRTKTYGLENITPYGSIGHRIFQVPENQTVDKTPIEDRVFLTEGSDGLHTPCFMSIEPHLGRVNPDDNVRYGAKFQFVIPVGFGELATQLIREQYDFYTDLGNRRENPKMAKALSEISKFSGL